MGETNSQQSILKPHNGAFILSSILSFSTSLNKLLLETVSWIHCLLKILAGIHLCKTVKPLARVGAKSRGTLACATCNQHFLSHSQVQHTM